MHHLKQPFPYHQPVEYHFALPTHIYGGMLVLWLLRKDLQKRYPLHLNQYKDHLHFLAWCTMIGRRESQLLKEMTAWNEELTQPIHLPKLKKDVWCGVFSTALYLAGLHRSKNWEPLLLGNVTQRHRVARWFFREGRFQLSLQKIPDWQLQQLKNNFISFDHFIQCITLPKDDAVTRDKIINDNRDISTAWSHTINPSPTPPQKHVKHTATKLAQFIAGLLPVAVTQLIPQAKGKKKQPDTAEQTQVAKKINNLPVLQNQLIKKEATKPFGVNLYGYAKGELGIGEDVRMLAKALDAAKIPFCIINIELGQDVSQQDTSVEDWLVSEAKYHFNIFCMTGIEMSRYVIKQGRGILQGHYNIGLWPWELPAWPEAWHHAWSLVDELWGISQYTARAYNQAPVPVHAVPLPVTIDAVAAFKRKHWQLPEQAYLFVFSFDMNSRLTRKNPEAVIQAFKKASKNMTVDQVGLVLKISHLKRSKPDWKALEKMIDQDPRIHLITTELRRPEVLALYKNCNCYVSLHRSEGFGRGLAEAQLLGLQLIATGYSGNMDFCQPPTHCVDYQLIKLKPGDYFYGDGQHWAEPDVNQCAQFMQQRINEGINKPTPDYSVENFSPQHCGQSYLERLAGIYQNNTTV